VQSTKLTTKIDRIIILIDSSKLGLKLSGRR